MSKPMTEAQAGEIADRHAPRIMRIRGVESVGVSRRAGRLCLLVQVSDPEPEIRARIPAEVEGLPVRVEVGGAFEAQ